MDKTPNQKPPLIRGPFLSALKSQVDPGNVMTPQTFAKVVLLSLAFKSADSLDILSDAAIRRSFQQENPARIKKKIADAISVSRKVRVSPEDVAILASLMKFREEKDNHQYLANFCQRLNLEKDAGRKFFLLSCTFPNSRAVYTHEGKTLLSPSVTEYAFQDCLKLITSTPIEEKADAILHIFEKCDSIDLSRFSYDHDSSVKREIIACVRDQMIQAKKQGIDLDIPPLETMKKDQLLNAKVDLKARIEAHLAQSKPKEENKSYSERYKDFLKLHNTLLLPKEVSIVYPKPPLLVSKENEAKEMITLNSAIAAYDGAKRKQ